MNQVGMNVISDFLECFRRHLLKYYLLLSLRNDTMGSFDIFLTAYKNVW